MNTFVLATQRNIKLSELKKHIIQVQRLREAIKFQELDNVLSLELLIDGKGI